MFRKFISLLRQYAIPLILLVVIVCVGFVTAYATATAERNNVDATAREKATTFSESFFYNIQMKLDPAERATQLLSNLIASPGSLFDLESGQWILDRAKDAMPEWHNFSLAPNNCIAAVSPLEDNRGALGYCLDSNPDEWKIVSAAIEAQEPVFFGPVKLAQGGEGYIYDLPVYLADGSYWGLVTSIIDKDAFLNPLRTSASENLMNVKIALAAHSVDVGTTLIDTLDSSQPIDVTHTYVDSEAEFEITAAPIAIDYSGVDRIWRRILIGFSAFGLAVFIVAVLYQRQRLAHKQLKSIAERSPSVLFNLASRGEGIGTLEYVSESSINVLGLTPEEIFADNNTFFDRIDPRDRQLAAIRLAAVRSPGEVWSQRLRFAHSDGRMIWLQVEANYERNLDGVGYWYGVLVDATPTVKQEKELVVSAGVFSALNEGVAILDPEGIVLDVNPGLTKITGYSRSDIQGQPFVKFGEGLNEPALYSSLRQAVMTTGYWRGEIVNRHKSGAISKDMLTMTAVRDHDGKITEVIIVMNSIERMLIDTVTGLPNRILFEERMVKQLEEAQTNGVNLALLEIGVHGVGAVNHTFGYKIGDLLLHEIGERITSFAGAAKNIGRVGDTTFAVVIETEDDHKQVQTFAQEILQGLTLPFFIEEVSVLVNAAIGIAQFPQDSTTVEELRSHAGQAYKITADSGESAVNFFSPDMETGAKVRTYLTSDLQDALRDKKIQFFYQPIVRVSDRSIVKAETLARWFDDHLGNVSPARFIPLAEESGLIHELGEQLFESALDTALELQNLGRPIQISLNVSPVEIMAPTFVRMDQIQARVDRGLSTENIVFELTEGILLNRKDVIEQRIKECREQGIHFAIDDFGTGYSSLSYLQQLDVDFIKIDKSFIDKIETEEGFALCRSIVELAHALGLELIAEGVETESQLGLLDHLGCEFAQGYLFSPAVSRNDFMELLGFKQS